MSSVEQENQPKLANCATPELKKKLTKRRSLEGSKDVFEGSGEQPPQMPWLPRSAQGPPFAWPLDNVGEIFSATSTKSCDKVREISKTVGARLDAAVEAARTASRDAAAVCKAQLRAVRARADAARAMTPEERAAVAGAAKQAAVERVRGTSRLERGLFALVLALVCVLVFRGPAPAQVGGCAPAPAMTLPLNQTTYEGLQYELQATDKMHKECLAEFQTHLDMMLGQHHLDKRGRTGGAHLMKYADEVGKKLQALGMAPNFI